MDRQRRMIVTALAALPSLVVVGSSAEARMVSVSQPNKQVVLDLIEQVWRQGHIDTLPRFWTDDCLNHADPALEKRGLAALKRYHEGFATWFADFRDISIQVLQQIGEDDRVVTQMLLKATHLATARGVAMATIRIDHFEGGKIAEHWSVADMAGLAQQLA